MMATVLWDSHGIILIDYLEQEKAITGAYYTTLPEKLKASIVEKPQKKKFFFFH